MRRIAKHFIGVASHSIKLSSEINLNSVIMISLLLWGQCRPGMSEHWDKLGQKLLWQKFSPLPSASQKLARLSEMERKYLVPHPPEEMFLNVGPDDFTCKHRDKLGRKLLSLLMTRLGYHGVQKARSTRTLYVVQQRRCIWLGNEKIDLILTLENRIKTISNNFG